MNLLLLLLLPILGTASTSNPPPPTIGSLNLPQPPPPAPLCDQYSYWSSGTGYEINNNLWGRASASSGSQCTHDYYYHPSNNSIQWRTTWTWAGSPNTVKSFAYAARQIPRGQTIASIESMQTKVAWRYSTESNIRGNVAYDIFTAADPGHANSYGDFEVMIWLARFGNVAPIGSLVNTISIGGWSWNLWVGMNRDMEVFSFVVASTSPAYSWSGDARGFFDYLQRHHGFPVDKQHLIVYQFGTEAFTGGPATISVSRFEANVS